jgi:phenylpyruvate tautomerase PptA (4-oxalocrotonate tautomerase family)
LSQTQWKEAAMPLTHISLRAGKPDAYRQAIFDGLYRAMRETFDVPEDDQFMTIQEHDAANFRYGASYLGIARSDDLVLIQITAMNTRTVDQKKALFRRIAELLGQNPGIRPEDVLVSLVEGERENWSLGRGLAQYA